MDTVALEDVQRRLLLVLRSQHGPQAGTVWCAACTSAGVLSTGQLTLDELDRVAAVLAAGTGADAVAGRTARVRLVFLRQRAAAGHVPVDRAASPALSAVDLTGSRADSRVEAEPLTDSEVQAALRQPDALDPSDWLRRLAELERETA